MISFRDRVDRILQKCTKTFGESIEYYPRNGGFYSICGIFDNDYESIDPETEQLISSNQPVLGVNLNDVDFEMKINDTLKVRNLTYKVYEVREDGQGGASLLLHKHSHEKKVNKKESATSP